MRSVTLSALNGKEGLSVDEKARQQKKLWKTAEKMGARAKFPLSDDRLELLFAFVEAAVDDVGCDHSLKATRQWLEDNDLDIQAVIAWLGNNGGFCDCEVIGNAREHWEENRQ